MSRDSRLVGWFVLLAPFALLGAAGCPTARDLPPRTEDQSKSEPEDKKADVPFCGKVFSDPKPDTKTGKRGACCRGASAGIVKSADVVAACGVAPAAYLGEAPDGDACRLYFTPAAGGDVHDSWLMVNHPVIPPGSPAPVRPSPMLPWNWKKLALRDAIAYQAQQARDEPGLLEHHHIFWAGRGRRILGLHVSKQLCDQAHAEALLQRAIDAIP